MRHRSSLLVVAALTVSVALAAAAEKKNKRAPMKEDLSDLLVPMHDWWCSESATRGVDMTILAANGLDMYGYASRATGTHMSQLCAVWQLRALKGAEREAKVALLEDIRAEKHVVEMPREVEMMHEDWCEESPEDVACLMWLEHLKGKREGL